MVLDGPRSVEGVFEALDLGDKHVSNVAAVAVAADAEVFGIGNAVFHQRVDAFENIFAGTRDDLGNNLFEKFVAVSGGAAVVGLEDQPSVGGGERGPLIPVCCEMVAIGVGGAAIDEGEQGQMLWLKFSWRIDQHAFDGCAVVCFPAVGLALRKVALGEKFVEGSNGT